MADQQGGHHDYSSEEWDDETDTYIYYGGKIHRKHKNDYFEKGYRKIKNARTATATVVATAAGAGATTTATTTATIDDDAFLECNYLENVEIYSDHIVHIGNSAYRRCHKLKNVTFSNSNPSSSSSSSSKPSVLISIGSEAFRECKNMESISIPESVQVIHHHAFFACFALTNIQLSNSLLQVVDEYTFNSCTNLKEIVLPSSLKEIRRSAFMFCSNLMTISMPDTVELIGVDAFTQCRSLKEIQIFVVEKMSSDHGTIDGDVNDDTGTKKKLMVPNKLPASMKRIGHSAFLSCKSLVSVELSSSSTSCRLEPKAFGWCDSLQHMTLPDSLEELPDYVFRGCSALKSVEFTKSTTSTTTNAAAAAAAATGSTTLLRGIGTEAFALCSSLKMMTLPNSVRFIGPRAFQGCLELEEIDLPILVKKVSQNAFEGCPRLAKIGSHHQYHQGIDTNSIHYFCDLARGGRQYIVRHNDDRQRRKVKYHPSGLWPLIVYRTLNVMDLPHHEICDDDTDNELYTTAANPMVRRASVIYFLMINGIVMDMR